MSICNMDTSGSGMDSSITNGAESWKENVTAPKQKLLISFKL